MNILVVEDNAQNLYLARFLLEARGHQVSAATTGEAGLEAVAGSVPDLVLLDIQLPGIDGYQVARAMRAMGTLDAVPIVAVTSYAMESDRRQAFAAGCDGYVEKPIDPATFCAVVEQARRRPPGPGRTG